MSHGESLPIWMVRTVYEDVLGTPLDSQDARDVVFERLIVQRCF